VHEVTLAQWRADAEAGLAEAPGRRRPSAEARKVVALERELRRKEKALAEVSALLVLKNSWSCSGGTRTTTLRRGAGDDR
jgi:transposase